jgi:hypothetical protein
VLGAAVAGDRHAAPDHVRGGSAAVAGAAAARTGRAIPDPDQAVQRRSVVDSGDEGACAGTAVQPSGRGMNWRVGQLPNLSK